MQAVPRCCARPVLAEPRLSYAATGILESLAEALIIVIYSRSWELMSKLALMDEITDLPERVNDLFARIVDAMGEQFTEGCTLFRQSPPPGLAFVRSPLDALPGPRIDW